MVRRPRRRLTTAVSLSVLTGVSVFAPLLLIEAAAAQENRHGARWGAPTNLYEGSSAAVTASLAPLQGDGSARPVPVIMAPGERFSAARINVTATAPPRTSSPPPRAAAAPPHDVLSSLTESRGGPRPHRKIGAPYQVSGIWYVPARDDDYAETGVASWYGPGFHGRETANGEIFDENLMTAAHPTLPLPSIARVTNTENGASILVRVNDRGPFARDRIIDLSRRAAQVLGFEDQGTAPVLVEFVGDAPLPGETPSRAFASLVRGEAQSAATPATPRSRHATAPARAQTAGEDMFVQTGAFSTIERARAALAQAGGMPGFVQTAWVNDRTLYRVLVGPWDSERAAEAARSRVARQGFPDARVVSTF